MTNRKYRETLSGPHRIDGNTTVRNLGYDKVKQLGCPMTFSLSGILAWLGDDNGLLRAARDGCPVDWRVAYAAVARGHMDMLVWAKRQDVDMCDKRIGEVSGLAPPHVIKWLALEGCPVAYGLTAAAAVDNVEAAKAIQENARVDFRTWTAAITKAKTCKSKEVVDYITSLFGGHAFL